MKAIVAVDESWGIGYNGDMLFHIPEDLRFFKQKTLGNAVLMGKNTFLSLSNGALPNRQNIVLTTSKTFKPDNVTIANCFDQAKDLASSKQFANLYIIGGAKIYNYFLQFCGTAYVTKIMAKASSCDTFFPNIDNMSNWKLIKASEIKQHNNISFRFCKYINTNIL